MIHRGMGHMRRAVKATTAYQNNICLTNVFTSPINTTRRRLRTNILILLRLAPSASRPQPLRRKRHNDDLRENRLLPKVGDDGCDYSALLCCYFPPSARHVGN